MKFNEQKIKMNLNNPKFKNHVPTLAGLAGNNKNDNIRLPHDHVRRTSIIVTAPHRSVKSLFWLEMDGKVCPTATTSLYYGLLLYV